MSIGWRRVGAQPTVGGVERSHEAVLEPSPSELVSDTSTAVRLFGDRRAEDLQVFEGMRRGEVPVALGMRRVAQSGGWPIRTSSGLYFATPAIGGSCQLAGDHNQWRPEALRQDRDLLWQIVPNPSGRHRLGYKLVVDGGFRPDPWARRYTYDEHGELSLVSSAGRHLERWPLDGAGNISSRWARVWIPEGPVSNQLYAHDGQNLFDPKASYGGWRLQHAVGKKTMVIGVDNSERRYEDYTHTTHEVVGDDGQIEVRGGNGFEFAEWMEQRTRPFMEARYGAAKRVGLLGSSLGAVIALLQGLKYPGSYDFIGAMSPSLDWGAEGERVIDLYRDVSSWPTALFLYSGGPPNDNYDVTMEFKEFLDNKGLPWGDKLFHYHNDGGAHREDVWADQVGRLVEKFESLPRG